MENVTPAVSVIVPVYNVERFLDQALESIEGQTCTDLEIICVNDGSTDRSPEIARAHAARDSRIRVIDKPNGGYGSACNRGIDEARGTWIAIVEPDDWIEPGMYADMLAFAATFHADIDIVKTPYWRMIDPDTPAQRRLNCSYKGRIRPKRQPFTLFDAGTEHLLIHHPSIWSALYRADFMRERDIRFREIPGAGWADNPFLLESLCQARSIVYLDRAYYCYREETDEKSASFAERNPDVPFARWHDMMDVLERLGVRDERVLRVQFRRGFTYLDYISNGIDLGDPKATAIMERMFARMDDSLVMAEPNIPPAWKRRYLQVKGLPQQTVRTLPYALALAKAGCYSVVNVGPSEALHLVGAVAKRDRTAEALNAGPSAQGSEGAAAAIAAGAEGAAGHGVQDANSAEGERRDWTRPVDSDVTFSVIVPVYNSEAYLEACLESLSAQVYGSFEAICVNDGSPDNSRAILEAAARKDPRIRIIDQPNGGPSSARNTGMRAATGDYLVFLDADDLLEPHALNRIAGAQADGHPDAVVFGWSCFPEGLANEWLSAHTSVRDAFYPRFASALLFEEMTNPYLRLAVRRTAVIEDGIFFDEALGVGEDGAFLFALFPRIGSTRLISDRLYRYRMPHEGSIMSRSKDGTATKCADDLNMMISIFGDWGRAGLLGEHAAPLMHWFISFWLYTALRQPREVRDSLVELTRKLWLAHFSAQELRSLPLPRHDSLLVEYVLSPEWSEVQRSRALAAWRIAEYGPLDLVRTLANHVKRPQGLT